MVKFSLVASSLIAAMLFAGSALAQRADVSFNKNGEKATVSVRNTTNTPCYVDFEIEVYSKLISSGDPDWRDKTRASWKVVANSTHRETFYEKGISSEHWRIEWISNECS